MKKIAIASLIAMSMITTASAQQRCTPGIYTGANGTYVSVHTNGNAILAVAVNSTPANNAIQFSLGKYGTVTPIELPTWSYQLGQWDGSNSYLGGGQVMHGACYALTQASCTTSSLSVTFSSLQQMPVGTSSGINCASIYSDMVSTQSHILRYDRFF